MADSAGWSVRRMAPERVLALSDGVFAIAMTLLVIDIKIPEIPASLAAVQLPHAVADLVPRFLMFALSFVVVAMFWMAHHRVFSHVKACDGWTLWLNTVFLLFVAFLPFPTGLVGEYGDDRFAAIFYAASMAVTSLPLTALMWHVAGNPELLRDDRDPRWIRAFTVRNLAAPAIFFLSIPLAFVSADAAELSWWLIPVVRRLLDRFIRLPAESE